MTEHHIPQHIGIIMDGNNRWAKLRGKRRLAGHAAGADSLRSVTRKCVERDVRSLSIFAFSSENWNRPKHEINALMELLVSALNKEIATFKKNNIQLCTIGEKNTLPDKCREKLDQVINETSANDGLKLVLALSYSSKLEIINSIKNIAQKIANKTITIEQVNETLVSNELYTYEYPDPDLLIRTSGEFRISNFLLWQIAYTELYFSPKLWPDFTKTDFIEALIEYQSRERRFGKTSEQIKN